MSGAAPPLPKSYPAPPGCCHHHPHRLCSSPFSPISPVAPRIVVDPKPTVTDIGSDVTLTCVWSGNPPLTLTWTKKESNMVRSTGRA